MKSHRDRQSAFTLLEVILAVALTAVIMVLIAGAIDMHLRQLTARRAGIEEAQLARAILRRIADDLRAVVVNKPTDFSSVDLMGEMGEMLGDDPGMGDSSMDMEMDTESSTAAEELAAYGILPDELGICGNLYELHIDISRIPRYEEYDLLMQMGDVTAAGSLGDVKTVSYLLLGASTASGMNSFSSSWNASGYGASASQYGTPGYGNSGYGASGYGNSGYGAVGYGGQDPYAAQGNTGLARRVMERATIRFAQDNGDFGWLDQQAEVFAPEVMAIEFAYFDGYEWLLEWTGGLPVAVEIVLVLRPDDASSLPESTLLTSSGINYDLVGPDHVYRLVVHLPAADPLTEEDMLQDTMAEEGGL